MSGFELYFFISGIIFHAVLVVLVLMYFVIPIVGYLACSFSFHNFYAKGIGKKFGWWAWKASFRNWMTYGGGGIKARPAFGEWRGFGDYTLYKDNPVPEDAIVYDDEDWDEDESEDREDRQFESTLECNRRSHLKAPTRKPRPNIPTLKGKSK